MDSDQSFSGDSNNSSENSNSSSSDGEEEAFEPVRILGHCLELPQDLCEDHSIFKEFFSMKTWEALDDKHKEHLKKFLPKFPENDETEKDLTVKMLFDCEPFKFTSPLDEFYNNLKQGNYRPDIAKMKSFLLKARTKQQKHKMKSYYAKLLPEVLISRERLLAAAISAPPGPAPQLPLMPPKPSKNNYRSPHVRAKQRYFEELDAINIEVGGMESEDDNYPEGSPVLPHKKKFQGPIQANDGNVSSTLGGYDPTRLNSLEGLRHVLAAHKARRQFRENHPELNTSGITLEDIKQRVALMNGAKKLMFGGPKVATASHKLKRGPKKDPSGKKPTEPKVKKIKAEPIENKPIAPNIKIKSEKEDSDSESSSFVDPVASPRSLKRTRTPESIDIKKELLDSRYPDCISNSKPDKQIKRESHDCKKVQPVPIKLEDLDGIDMMDLPVELAEETVESQSTSQSHQPDDSDKSLTETTYANFLCLVRALFPARAAHRASKQQLKARCAAVMRSPIAPLNTWYHLSDNWCAGLETALEFLAGKRGPHPNDFVPYLQYLPDTQMYQWIGAGRDCDAILQRLCDRWLRAASPQPPPINNEAPPPKYPTCWTVRAPTSAELAQFRLQERKRFASATKPFTYVQHGYRSVVGPCGRVSGGGEGVVGGGPRVVCVTSLLKDAVARLPNGEGTTHHILTLFRMSQYVSSQNDEVLLSVITSALDKLVSVKRDPFVKYDKKTAIWTYLHRHKSEEEWGKPTGSKNKVQKHVASRLPTPEPPPMSPPSPPTMAIEDMGDVEECACVEVVESGSDVEVDVEEAEEHVSQAQLLRQAAGGVLPAQQAARGALHAAGGAQQNPRSVQIIHAPTSPNIIKTQQPLHQTKPHTQIVIPVPSSQPQQITKLPSLVQKSVHPLQKQNVVLQLAKGNAPVMISKQSVTGARPNTSPGVVTQLKSPLLKQRPLLKIDTSQIDTVVTPMSSVVVSQQSSPVAVTVTPASLPTVQITQNKVSPCTRSLLLRPPAHSGIVTPALTSLVTTAHSNVVTPANHAQLAVPQRRGIVRVLSPATPTAGKSLISPRSLLQQDAIAAANKRVSIQSIVNISTAAQSVVSAVNVINTVPTISTSTATMPTRTLQLSSGRTVQYTNQTVHLPSGQAVQLTPGHTLQLQLPTQSVRLPSGQTVQLASPQTVRALSKLTTSPRQSSPTPKPNQTQPVIPASSFQLAGQTVQMGGQSVQLTGHTVKLPSGQSVQVASQNLLSRGQVQLASGQNLQTVQLTGQNMQLGGQPVQISGQTVQLASGQTIQLPTLQLSGGQTVQLPSGQTLQLSGQTVQLASQAKPVTQQVVRNQLITGTEKQAQPIVAKLLTNAQGQMISLENMIGSRNLTRIQKPQTSVSGVRLITTSGTRPSRPVLLTAAKPLHNIILQQSDGSTVRVTSSGGTLPTQAIVISSIGGQTVTTSSTSTPVLKLQQVNQLQHVKLAQGIKLQQSTSSAIQAAAAGASRSVVVDGQQLKLISGRHVLARLVRPQQPPQHQ